MTKNVKAVLLTVTVLLAAVEVALALQSGMALGHKGGIRAIGVVLFLDSACTQPALSIDWGDLEPGQTKAVTIYAKNVKNANCTLSHAISDWAPLEAQTVITLGWNYDGTILHPKEVKSIVLTLQVNTNIGTVDSFSFIQHITAQAG